MENLPQNDLLEWMEAIVISVHQADDQIAAAEAEYRQEIEQVHRRYEKDLASLENTYKANCSAARKKVEDGISLAKGVRRRIDDLDFELMRADAGFKIYKTRNTQLAADEEILRICNGGYHSYIAAIEQISLRYEKVQANCLAYIFPEQDDDVPAKLLKLYSAFSGMRSRDYEELIVLWETAVDLEIQMCRISSQLVAELLESTKANYTAQRSDIEKRQETDKRVFEKKYSDRQRQVVARFHAGLDAILPDEMIDVFLDLKKYYGWGLRRVNPSGYILPENILNFFNLECLPSEFPKSAPVASVFNNKFAKFLAPTGDGTINLPAPVYAQDVPVWRIVRDNSNRAMVNELTHAIMFGMLSFCPVGKLTYTIADPEEHGNSISPYLDAKKSFPELFGEGIIMTKEGVAAKIGKLNEKIGNILHDRLGDRYKTVFDLAKDDPGYDPKVELVILYDFPQGFDEGTLAALANVLRNGSRCGIYTVIVYRPDLAEAGTPAFRQGLEVIRKLSFEITNERRLFGLPVSYYLMPEKAEASKFFNKYMFALAGRDGDDIAVPPLIQKLVEGRDAAELDAYIERICVMKQYSSERYAQAPELDAAFPSQFVLGRALYPEDIFSDSAARRQILERFSYAEEGQSYIELPLNVDLHRPFNLLLTGPKGDSKMLGFTHHVIWSFLSYLPATMVDVCVFDNEQRGNSVMPFLSFRKSSPDTFDQKIYTSQEEMAERLRKISDQIDGTIQEKLRDQYRDILEYNQNTHNRTEPVTLLILYDFPAGMDGRSIDLLMDILRNGNKCGVFTVICRDPKIPLSGYGYGYEDMDKRLEQMAKYCICVECDGRGYTLLPSRLQIRIPERPSDSAMAQFTDGYVKTCEAVKARGFSFDSILSPQRFSLDAAQSLDIPVGVGDGDSIVRLTIGKGSSHHGLIAGATGSGKSTFLHTLIMSAMLHYSPDQLHLYLMDFKSGAEFKIYESVPLPHIRLLALDAMQEFGESILENLVAEMERRGSLFKEAGQTSLEGYIRAAGQPLPRILVIMDEFQVLFNDSSNRKIAMNCDELTKRIVTEGRAFGIHLLMATQSTKVISELKLSSGTIEQMRIRIGLKCGEYDARYLFSDGNDAKALSMMKGPVGTAVMNLDYMEQKIIGFRVAYCDEAAQRYYLDLISNSFAGTPAATQVFEGGRTTRLLDYFTQNQIGITDELPVRLHIGELIKVAPPLVIAADRRRRHNLLVCGTNGKMANVITQNYLLSALLDRHARVYYISGDTLVDDDPSNSFCETLSQWSGRFRQAQNRGDIFRFINEVYEIYQDRKKRNGKEVIFVLLQDLQFLDVVCSMLKQEPVDESDYLEAPPEEPPAFDPADPFAAVNSMLASRERSAERLSTGEKLTKLMKDGYAFGIHFVVTALEYQTVRECMYYGENILSKFPERIIFDLNPRDAESLIENAPVTDLRENMVYFTDGVKNNFQVKPFLPPEAEELRQFLQNLDSPD